MSSLLLAVLEAFLVTTIIVIMMLLVYGLSIRSTRSLTRRSAEKQRPFVCGESIPQPKTGLPDSSMYTAIWRLTFKTLYLVLRARLHTGILNDWLTWMLVFMVVMVLMSMVVLL